MRHAALAIGLLVVLVIGLAIGMAIKPQPSEDVANESSLKNINADPPRENRENRGADTPNANVAPAPALVTIRALSDLFSGKEAEFETWSTRFDAGAVFRKITGAAKWSRVVQTTRDLIRDSLIGLIPLDQAIEATENPLEYTSATLGKSQWVVNYVASCGEKLNIHDAEVLLNTAAVIASTAIKGYEKTKAYRDSGVLQGSDLAAFRRSYAEFQRSIMAYNKLFREQKDQLGMRQSESGITVLPEDRPDR